MYVLSFVSIKQLSRGHAREPGEECHMLPAVPQPGDLKFKIGTLALMCLLYASAPQFPPFVSHA